MKNKNTYTKINGINYPNLYLTEQSNVNIGKYAQMQLDFLNKHRRGVYTTLLIENKLTEYSSATDEKARSMFDSLIAVLAQKRGINENLKATNHLLLVQEMNKSSFFKS